jgi:hypothetical protein
MDANTLELLKELADHAQDIGKIHQTDVGNAYTSQIPPAPDKELRQIEDKLVSVVADSSSIWSP